MPLSPAQVAEHFVESLRSTGRDVITIEWPEFYRLAERQRLRSEFLDDVGLILRKHGLLMGSGLTVLIVAKDVDFAPFEGSQQKSDITSG